MKKNVLFLFALCSSLMSWAQSSPYTGSEVAAGDFYIYNVETGYWLQNNNRVNDWNSQVQVDVQGFDWELIALDGGTWQLNPKFGNNHSLNSDADNGYMDTGRPVSAWTLTPVDGVSNGYTISSNGTTLGVNTDSKLLVKDGSSATVWQLVTAEERLAKLVEQASEVKADAPVDITWMIPGANINIADERFSQLVITNPDNAGAKLPTNQGNNPGNCVREIWNNSGAYNLGYTLTGLPDGVYRLTVSGFYRDGNTSGIGAKVANGTEEIRAFIYINEKTQPMMSVCQRKTSGNGCNVQTGSYYVPDALGDARSACSAGYYVNPAVKVVVKDGAGTIKLGIKADSGVGGDWMVLDYFKLLYYGPDNLPSYIALLQTAIDEAEAWDASNTSTYMANALADAITDAKAKLTSEDTDEIEAATTAVTEALNAAKAVDLSVLKATVALAAAEGLDVTAAEYLIANTTDGAGATEILEQLRAARKINALRMPDIYTGSAPAAGNVYLFNIGTGLFLGTGSDWNTHAAVDQAGIVIELVADGDNFKMKTNRGGGWLNWGAYVDTGNQDIWHFVPVDGKENVYNISSSGNDGNLLGYDPNGPTDGKKYWSTIAKDRTGFDNPMNQWKVVTPAERDALIETASEVNPIDATYLIKNPSLTRQDGYDMWNKEGGARVSSTTDGNGNRAADYGWEFYDTNSFKFYQDLEGLTPGVYEVSATAFYRDGDGGYQAGVFNDGGELLQLAYLFANDQKTPLPNIATVRDMVPGVASRGTNDGSFVNWPAECFEYFETGYYKTTVRVNVGADGKLSLGIAKDSKSHNGDWVVLDNFRLTCLGVTPYVAVGETGYATYVAPYDVDFTGAQVSAYAANINNDKGYSFVDLTEVTTVPAGSAVVVKAAEAGSYAVAKITGAEDIFGNELVAATSEVTADGTQYILANQEGKAGFAKATPATKIPAGKGYLVIAPTEAVKAFYPFFGEDATAIANVNVNDNDTNAVIYNVAGQRISKMQKGINIVNGKKVLK